MLMVPLFCCLPMQHRLLCHVPTLLIPPSLCGSACQRLSTSYFERICFKCLHTVQINGGKYVYSINAKTAINHVNSEESEYDLKLIFAYNVGQIIMGSTLNAQLNFFSLLFPIDTFSQSRICRIS